MTKERILRLTKDEWNELCTHIWSVKLNQNLDYRDLEPAPPKCFEKSFCCEGCELIAPGSKCIRRNGMEDDQ